MWDGGKAELRGKFIPLNSKMRNVSSQHRTPVKHLKMKNRRVILTDAEEHLTKFNTVYDKSVQEIVRSLLDLIKGIFKTPTANLPFNDERLCVIHLKSTQDKYVHSQLIHWA